jgi:PucR C-terminal helix-turn-helix domain
LVTVHNPPIRAAILAEVELAADPLVDRMMAEIRASSPLYDGAPDALLAEVRTHCHEHLRVFLRCGAEDRAPARRELAFVGDRAATRARQGIPLEALIQSYIAGQRAIWGAIHAATPPSPDGLAAGDELTAVTFAYTKAITAMLTDAYEAELRRIADDHGREDARALAADLLAGRADGEDPRLAGGPLAAARAIRVAVVAVTPRAERDRAVAALARHAVAAGWAEGELVALLADEGAGAATALVARAATLLRERGGEVHLRAGVSLPAGFGALGPCLDEARRALVHAPAPDGAVALDAVGLLDEVARQADGLVHRLVGEEIREALADPVARTTLDAYAEADLNVQRAAAALDVHPNTVHYRLDRLRERTGRDPRRFHELVDLLLARMLLEELD